jgi:hypothetical protein
METLQGLADSYAQNRDVARYMAVRADMDKLTDEDPAAEKPVFIAPDTGNLIVGNWLDEDGDIMPEAPNDMLLSNLYQSSYTHVKQSDQIEDMLRDRGYTDKDLRLAKYFRFKKEDDDFRYREVSSMEVIRALADVQDKVGIVPHTGQREVFIRDKFGSSRYGFDISKDEAQKCLDDYKEFLVDSYQ